MKLSQIILEEYQEQLKKFDGVETPMKIISEGVRMFTQAHKDALYMEREIRGCENDRNIHLQNIMNDFMVRNKLFGSEAVNSTNEYMKQFQAMTLIELSDIASKVENPAQK